MIVMDGETFTHLLLTRLAWHDDSQIVAWHAYKHYTTPGHPVGATITIQELRRC